MKLSIIIVNYNTKKLLQKCLASIYRSLRKRRNNKTYSLSYEVIVVDNGSEEKLKAKDEQLKTIMKNLNLKLIENKKNLGFGRANNQGVKRALGEFILFLNPDTLIPSGSIDYMLRFMEAHKEVGVATCRVELANGELDDACHRGFPTPWRAFCYFSGLARLFPKSMFFNGYHLGYRDMDKIHEIEACAGAFMLVRRRSGEEIAWFDEDYFWYGEDLDFCFRIKKEGWKVMYVPAVSIVHYKGISSGIKRHSQALSTADEKTRRLAQKARFEAMRIFYQKHYKSHYPRWISGLVNMGINTLKLIYREEWFDGCF